MNRIKIGDRVRLNVFNGAFASPGAIPLEDNYWQLIGSAGVVLGDSPSFTSEDRLLVKFDNSVPGLGLACHNPVENSLWLLRTDLSKL